MKTIKTIILILATSFLVNGCAEFLDSDPLTSLVESTFYKTEADAELALVGCYDGLQTIYAQDDLPSLVGPTIMSDECFGGGGTGDGFDLPFIDQFDYQVDPSIVDIHNATWVWSYKAIYRCNMLLSKLDQIEWQSDTKRNEIEAEARFIRAYIYFELGKLLGNIPLVTIPLTKEEANIEQASPEDLFKQIAEDFSFAAENGLLKGEQWTPEWASANDGHVTCFAAKAMLARVFLFYTGYYNKESLPNGTTKSDVITALNEVYSSGHGLVENYNELWPAACSERDATLEPIGLKTTYVGEGNKETVWAIKFNSTGNWGYLDGFRPMRIMGMRSGSILSFGKTVYGDGSWGGCPVSPKFVSEWKAEEAADPRMNWSVVDCTAEGIKYSSGHDQREYTGLWPKKYICLGNGTENIYVAQSLDFQWNQYTDFIVVRYADVLLMLSELSKDVKYINEVRARVNLEPIAAYSEDVLRKERKHEFAFEGIRFWDLLRYDANLDYAANAISFSGTVINGGGDTGSSKVIDGSFLKTCKGLSQIPNKQITLSNGVLKQNTGWSN